MLVRREYLSGGQQIAMRKLANHLRTAKQRISPFDALAFLPSLFFLFMTARYWGEPPSLDPMVVYRESTQFYRTGLEELSKIGYTLHPPLINILLSAAFFVFGKEPSSYNVMGFLVFFSTSLSFYFFIKDIYTRAVAALATILLFCNPIIIVNAFYLGNDLLILSGTLLALIFYVYRKHLFLSVTLAIMVLMKESALVVIATFGVMKLIEVGVKVFKNKEKWERNVRHGLVFLLPFATYVAWRLVLKSYGLTEWRERMFVETDRSSFELVLSNLVTGEFANKFLKANLENLAVFNFQWVYSVLIVGLGLWLVGRWRPRLDRRHFVLAGLGLVAVFYCLLTLSFPTFTNYRYVIPVLPFVFLLLAVLISSIRNIVVYGGLVSVLAVVIILSNVASVDPVTRAMHKGEYNSYGESFYNVSWFYRGPDRAIYNIEFLSGVERQNSLIREFLDSRADVLLMYCDEFKMGEKIYSLSVYNEFYGDEYKLDKHVECVNGHEIANQKSRLDGKTLYVRTSDRSVLRAELRSHGLENYSLVEGNDY